MQWFRRAPPAAASWNLAKTAVQIVAFWGLFLFVLPPLVVNIAARFGFLSQPTALLRAIGAVLFVGASTLGLFSAFTIVVHGCGTPLPLDAPRAMVVTGPYAWVRNPMALAGLTQGLAIALWHGSIAVAAYVVLGGAMWHIVVRPHEEADLARTFGAQFVDYKKRVPLWWPCRPDRRPSATSDR